MNENIQPPDDGSVSWMTVTDNDRVLVREKGIPNVAENPVEELLILSLTINHDWVCACRPETPKLRFWVKAEDYELLEILPPFLPDRDES